MKVSYRGVQQELPVKFQNKIDARFGKIARLLERRGEKEAHVMVTAERHLHHAEITLPFYDHQLIGIGADADLFTALMTALEMLEKQALKQREKWREKARRNGAGHQEEAAETAPPAAKSVKPTPPQRVNRVTVKNRNKPMTLEEAMMEMENGRDYFVYRDVGNECLSVLVRRRDGNIDLIES
ncbi:MAG TPA: HPF/RaiA family ribosome-associated protein [Bryobacteraceae bacterium]|nr:HPF/RaiA family ribosome-associated protein [Bryobacteraceae bacterium]